MSDLSDRPGCPDRGEGASRRDFLRTLGGAVVAGTVLPGFAGRASAAGGPTPDSKAETAVKRLYEALSAEQKKVLCFPFDHPLRKRINANWAITKPTIDELSNEQQALVTEIFKGVTSPEGFERFTKQMEDDDGGLGRYHVALFGDPGSGKFEWELTGRHVTIRADGGSVDGSAFGGPIIYGHGEGEAQKGLPGNVFYYQTQKANEVFKALDGRQRAMALVAKAPSEDAVAVQGSGGTFRGIGVGELSSDQKGLVESVLKVLLAPYREEDVDEAMSLLRSSGGVDALHMAFYEANDLGKDQEWDLWRIEGPEFVWHFRGAPHVHAYVNIARKA